MGFSMVTGSGNRFQYQYNRQRGQIVILLIGRKGGWRGDLEHLVLSASHPSCLLSADQVSDTVETEVQGWRWLEDTSTNHWSLYSRRECGSKALLWIFSLSILLGKWGPDLFFFFFFSESQPCSLFLVNMPHHILSTNQFCGKVLLSYPFYKWGNWGLEKLSCLKLFEPK